MPKVSAVGEEPGKRGCRSRTRRPVCNVARFWGKRNAQNYEEKSRMSTGRICGLGNCTAAWAQQQQMPTLAARQYVPATQNAPAAQMLRRHNIIRRPQGGDQMSYDDIRAPSINSSGKLPICRSNCGTRSKGLRSPRSPNRVMLPGNKRMTPRRHPNLIRSAAT